MEMEPSPAVAAELWRPPHLAAGGGRPVEMTLAVTEKNSGGRGGGGTVRRRPRGTPVSEDDSSQIVSTSGAGGGKDLINSEAKRSKTNKSSNNNGSLREEAQTDSRSACKAVSKSLPATEPPKQDYIHVRARRGQATDSHSLAERARREKISERMKVLQDLVPGCNKVIGKASVLDEIINYIQSLQRQVEFLSMKLEAVTAHANREVEAFPAKDTYSTGPGLTFGTQTSREYAEGTSTSEWLHMQIGSGYERVP